MTHGIPDFPDLATAVAHNAIDQLAAATRTIRQFEALLKAARPGVAVHSDAAHLLDFGVYAACEQANGFDLAREDLLARLVDSAPQKATSRNRGTRGAAC